MKCILESQDPNYLSLELKNKEITIVGRGPLTKIKTSTVSKVQLKVTADFSKRTVHILQVGPNHSYLNDVYIGIGLEETGKEGDVIQLLKDQFSYKIVFEGRTFEQELAERIKEQKAKEAAAASASQSSSGHSNSPNTTNKQKPAELDSNPRALKIPRMFTNGFLKDSQRKDRSKNWKSYGNDNLLVYHSDVAALDLKNNIGAFDMDGTLITTKSGRTFPRDDNDWQFLSTSTPIKLREFFNSKKDFKFVIITNQAGISSGNTNILTFKKKIEDIVDRIELPTIVLISTERDKFRKPLIGQWKVLIKDYNGELDPTSTSDSNENLNSTNKSSNNLNLYPTGESFYCGDAAGRLKDHSKVDRLFALNLNLVFKTPEEFFQGRFQKIQDLILPNFISRNIIESNSKLNNDHVKFPHSQEVGYPASGKSSYSKKVLVEDKKYIYVNRDTLKTIPKCVKLASDSLDQGYSVVIDNTNPDRKDRSEFIKIAQKFDVPVRCFKMLVSYEHAFHNNKFRQITTEGIAKGLGEVVYNTYRSRFQEPTINEGFKEIVCINWIPQFDDDKKLEIYKKFLLEK